MDLDSTRNPVGAEPRVAFANLADDTEAGQAVIERLREVVAEPPSRCGCRRASSFRDD